MRDKVRVIEVSLLMFFVCAVSYADGNSLAVYPDPAYEYAFGAVQIGQAIVKEVVIVNKGEELLRGSAILKIEETQQSEGEQGIEEDKDVFQIVSDANFALAGGEQFTMKIRFVPVKDKVYQAKLIIEASEDNRAELALVGVGIKKQKSYYLLGCGESEKEKFSLFMDLIFDLLFTTFVVITFAVRRNISQRLRIEKF